MNKKCAYILPLLLILMFSMPLNAQVTIRINQGLNFGSLYPVGSGGTVTISDDGDRLPPTGSVVLFPSTYHESSFTLSTTKKGSYHIAWLGIESPITMKRTGGGSLRLNLNTNGYNSGWWIARQTPVTLHMGGTLYVGSVSANPPGSYTGSFSIKLHYN